MKKEIEKNAKKLTGVVVGVDMTKTAKVRVSRFVKDKKYKKYIKKAKNYLVHDPQEKAKVGDKVLIQETRPISKRKRFKLQSIITAFAGKSEE